MITSSEFYNRLNTLETTRQLGVATIRAKGLEIEDTASLPMVVGKIAAITGTNVVNNIIHETTGKVVIITAELPGVTITLADADGNAIGAAQTTDATTGGAVSFGDDDFDTTKTYTLTATNADNETLWTKEFTINQIGSYNIKTGKVLEDYTWAEINTAAKNGYAKYMFELWDTKKLDTFMGSTNDTYRTCHIIGFDHDNIVGGGKAGITFMIRRTASTYKHHASSTSNINGISWRGSLIRANCLKTNDTYYVYVPNVTGSTEGTYYVLNDDNETYTAVTLPADYVAGKRYHTAVTLTEDGAFLAGLPADVRSYLVQVEKETWAGFGGTGFTNTVFKTHDWMFIPSDAEVFGETGRSTISSIKYSKYNLEGQRYAAFKEYKEDIFRYDQSRWLRSPYSASSGSYYFCFWGNYGYVYYNSASNGSYCPLCFCL